MVATKELAIFHERERKKSLFLYKCLVLLGCLYIQWDAFINETLALDMQSVVLLCIMFLFGWSDYNIFICFQ